MKSIWRRVFVVLGLLAIAYGAAYAFFAKAMRQTPDQFSRVMAHAGPMPFLLFPFESMWLQARAGGLRPGDRAPDFTLPLLNHSDLVKLSFFRGVRPVVLIFGSYT